MLRRISFNSIMRCSDQLVKISLCLTVPKKKKLCLTKDLFHFNALLTGSDFPAVEFSYKIIFDVNFDRMASSCKCVAQL